MPSRFKYRFEVLYQTQHLKQVSDLMQKLDLGMDEVCFRETIGFYYILEEKPISYFKQLIRQAMEASGNVLINIEGGKTE